MAWDDLIPFDSHETTTHIVYLFLGVFILLFGLYSHFIKDRLFMSEAFVATIFGIIVGPYALKLFDPKIDFEDTLYQVLLEVSRLVVGIQCMASGIALPGNYVWRSKLSIMVLLGPLMLAMWLVSSMGAKLIFGVSWTDAFVIGACVTPTDPVLANSVVRGAFAEAHIPPHVRLLLSAERLFNLTQRCQRRTSFGISIIADLH